MPAGGRNLHKRRGSKARYVVLVNANRDYPLLIFSLMQALNAVGIALDFKT